MRDQATATAPCHVSAFFVPHVVPREPERTGSAGAGICLDRHVTAHVRIAETDEPSVSVARERGGEARVTEAALRMLLGERRLAVTCTVHEGAPVGQGFGVSAASALSASFALARCLGEGRSDALRAAHLAEVRQRTGLGDVVGSFLGGVVLRSSPGLPPYGAQTNIPADGDLVVATVDEPIDTAGLLRDRRRLAEVTDVGRTCLETVLARPSLEAILETGAHFARETGLVAPATLDAIDACAEGGLAMAAMLGNTVVAYGDRAVLVDVLSAWGEPEVVGIDQAGLRLVRSEQALG